mmetsp:Transcript_21187/g.49263  ORF Transcript_21187/g.49263 Transcript_21187/m.49263 type:complete len:212 (+) Transcript_21187:719-1354(+)
MGLCSRFCIIAGSAPSPPMPPPMPPKPPMPPAPPRPPRPPRPPVPPMAPPPGCPPIMPIMACIIAGSAIKPPPMPPMPGSAPGAGAPAAGVAAGVGAAAAFAGVAAGAAAGGGEGAVPALGADLTMCIVLPLATCRLSSVSTSFRIRPLKMTFICSGSILALSFAIPLSSRMVADGARSKAKVLPPAPETLKLTLTVIPHPAPSLRPKWPQ